MLKFSMFTKKYVSPKLHDIERDVFTAAERIGHYDTSPD